MKKSPGNITTELRGIGDLTIDAILGVTDIVESLHQTILSFGGVLSSGNRERTRGIPGMVYRNIHTVTEWVGGGMDILLDRLSVRIGETPPSHGREAAVAALNGVLGDHLAARDNPLAIPMQFRIDGNPLDRQALLDTIEQSNGKLAIMVHGSCMNDRQWQRDGHDHGAMLARDLGVTPIYLYYNTGLHISENGRNFSDLLESLIQLSPRTLELFIITHSMGGLVSRSACHYAHQTGHTWLHRLRKLIFLGTPHHGAVLEKGGNWITILMDTSPYSAPFARLGKIRSAGVTDMRYGNITDQDWMHRDRFDCSGDQRMPVALPDGAACYAVAATTGKAPSKWGDGIVGDGLVTLNSALGVHKNPALNLSIPESRQWIGRNMNHMDLLSHPAVYQRLRHWMTSQP
ncbi:MAG: hypothetical protein U5L07_10285 [Desulfobacterales bacterium]|nr:hypothetical protein [Desulfobacterales bacterium]